MKKLIAISFLFLLLCSNTEVGELFKLPVLIHHYLEHHYEGSGVSFIAFLHTHYSGENNHSSPNNEHERLPFKSHSLESSQQTFAFQSPISFELISFSSLPKLNIIYIEGFYTSSISSRIWQPPKFC